MLDGEQARVLARNVQEHAADYLQDVVGSPMQHLAGAADRLNTEDPQLQGAVRELTQQISYLPGYLWNNVQEGGGGGLVPPDLARALSGVQDNLNRYGREHHNYQAYAGRDHPGAAAARIAQMALEILNQNLGDDALQENVLFPAAERSIQ